MDIPEKDKETFIQLQHDAKELDAILEWKQFEGQGSYHYRLKHKANKSTIDCGYNTLAQISAYLDCLENYQWG